MKLILLYLCLVGMSYASPLRKPRRAGYGSKSEEMMQFGPYGYINSPQIGGSFYGYHSNYPQMFPQWSVLPLQRFFLWPQSASPAHQASRLPQQKPQQIPGTKKPNQRPQLPPQQPRYQQPQPLPKQPQKTNPSQMYPQVPFQHPKEGKQQQPQGFPPYSPPPWHFPQHMPFGQPPVSNEEGTPYFGYGYHGLGNRPPYYSEEMFEQDFEKPKEKEPPKENPASDPTTNSTVSDTNSTVPASHAGNATLSGVSTINNEANLPGLSKKIVSGNGIATPSPTGHMSGPNEASQNGFDQSNYRPKSTNTNVFHNIFSGSQQPGGRGSYIYKPNPDMGNSRHNTLVSRGNPSMQAENPEEHWVYRDNSVHGASLQRINRELNHPIAKNRPNSYGQQEEFHYPGNNPSSWRAHPSSDPGPQWNNNPAHGGNKQPSSPSESHSLNKVEENTDRYHPSRKQQSNGQSHQDIFSDIRGTPFEKEAHKNDWNEQSFISLDHQREQFPSLQNQMWNQKDLEVVKGASPGYNSVYSPDSFHQRGHATYSDKNSYRQQAPSFHPRFWEDEKNLPTIEPLGQRERPSYSPLSPSYQMHRSEYHGSIQQENELYSRQNIWPREKHLADPDIQYQNPPYNPSEHHINPKYYTEQPANDRGNLPYEEINRRIPEHSPVHGSEHYENVPYHISHTHGHTERNPAYHGPYLPPQTSNLFPGRSPYDERDTWAPKVVDPSAPKETSPYFNTHSSNVRRNPTYTEDTWKAIHISAPFSSNNVPGRRNYPNTGVYPREHETITSQPTINYFCCAGESPGANENILAPLRIAPQFKLVSWEQKNSPTYPEGSHALYARRPAYLAGIQSNHWNNSLKSNHRENPGDFGEEVADLEMNPPCSNSLLSLTSDTIYETGLFPSQGILCSKNSIRGDGHTVLAHIVEVNQPKREFERTALRFPQPQGIRNEAVSEIDRKEHHATQGFGWTPCFGSWLKEHLSSTGDPLVDQPSDVFYSENSMYAGKPIMLPEPQPMSSTVPSQDGGEDQLELTSPEEQVGQPNERTTDCLLLQNE
ncbi:enamelin [Ahaetulla prasina]|uniref:enamelin n=1 Tax=Ahaetulla prasina TaxID=499056 RepID=UPI0026482704|nr:enamelin [Ahaetulla prasina]